MPLAHTPRAPRRTACSRGRSDRGEGVISAAIVVLIMAFLGVLMWTAFRLMFDDATARTRDQVEQIGS